LGALLLIGWVSTGYAQEPPLSVPKSGVLPATPGDALAMGDWLFYPTVKTYTQYTDNLFQSVLSPVSVWGFGIKPGLIAEWSNGIHTTTLYGNVDARTYPSATQYDVLDPQAGFVQKYSPLPDLTFRVQGDYTHQTLTSTLINAIPGAIASPGTIVLSNGNTVLPNGLIISPTGVVVGQVTPTATAANSTIQINPSNTLTGTASVEKILNRGFIGLSGSIAQTTYENTNVTPDYTVKSLTGNGAVWLSPLLYAYANGSFASNATSNSNTTTTTTTNSNVSATSTAYRVVGGIGTRQIGLFRASAYYGHQGSNDQGTAGGEVYGGSLKYYPTPIWTIGIGVDETVNISQQTGNSIFALNTGTQTALVIPLGASTRTTATSLNSSYQISQQWSATGSFGFTYVAYINSPEVENSWLADVILQYQMWRNMTLNWEYRYSSIVSNVPLNSSKSNFVAMSALYKF